MMVVAIVLTTACNKNDDEPIIEPGPNQMTMTTQYSNVSIHMAGVGTVTFDWGDKTEIKTYPLLDYNNVGWQHYNHVYSGVSAHTTTISGNGLTWFSCINTGTTQLDVSRNPELTVMSCADNPLKSLDVSSNTQLRTLFCHGNELTDLELSKNTELRILGCFGNDLTDLDVSNNTELVTLWCYSNQLSSLNFSFNSNLYFVNCHSNLLTSEALNALFETLHDNMFPGRIKIIYIGANPGTNDCNRSIAENKGWVVSNETVEFQ